MVYVKKYLWALRPEAKESTVHVLIGCYKLLNLTLHALVLPRMRFPPSVCFPAQMRKVFPRLDNHSLQPLVLLSPNGELQHDRLKFMMEFACCPLQLVNLPVQIIDAPSKNEEWY